MLPFMKTKTSPCKTCVIGNLPIKRCNKRFLTEYLVLLNMKLNIETDKIIIFVTQKNTTTKDT